MLSKFEALNTHTHTHTPTNTKNKIKNKMLEKWVLAKCIACGWHDTLYASKSHQTFNFDLTTGW